MTEMATEASGKEDVTTGFAPVNGLQMYYELHGTGQPLLLVHGAFSAIGTSFGRLLPELARGRRVVAVELQGHGRTADIDRPLSFDALVEDLAALLRYLGIERTDVFGYSMGGGLALALTIRYPALVRKLIYAGAASYGPEGFYPELLAGMEGLTAESLVGSPFHAEYLQLNPKPDNFPLLVEKVKRMNAEGPSISPEVLRGITAPTLLANADGDIVRPEHVVEMFRLLGGGVLRFDGSVSPCQLAIVPGTDHVTLMQRADLLLPMVVAFLEAPLPAGA